jgi:hypothetical protein
VVSAESLVHIERAKTYWIPHVQKISSKVPFVIAFSKLDLLPESIDLKAIETELLNNLYVEYTSSCSPKLLLNVQNPFYAAQKAVLFPSGPLLNADKSVIPF